MASVRFAYEKPWIRRGLRLAPPFHNRDANRVPTKTIA